MGRRQVAYRNDSGVYYIHQDHLGSTALVTDGNGNVVASSRYFPYGDCRSTSGYLDTDRLFTGQRLDQSGLYFYNARYYDSTIGRFISADSLVPDPSDPQNLNRYSYVFNNPLKYMRVSPAWRTSTSAITVNLAELPGRGQGASFVATASGTLGSHYPSTSGAEISALSAMGSPWLASAGELVQSSTRGTGASWAVLTHWSSIGIKGNAVYN